MSKKIESQVWASALECELKPLAAIMADLGNDDGLGIYPSVAYLAWLLGRSERAVQYQLQRLVDAGILSRISGAQGGRSRTPRYALYADALPKRPSWQELRKGATVAPFQENQKGATSDVKGATSNKKGAAIAPDPLVLDPSVDPKAYMPPSALPSGNGSGSQQESDHGSSNGNGSGKTPPVEKFRIPVGYSPPRSVLTEMTANLNFDRGETEERVKQWRHSRTLVTPRWFTSNDQMHADLAGYLSKCSTNKRR